MRLTTCSCVIALLLAGCTPQQTFQSDPAELMRADADFAAATAARGVDGWVSFFADSGAMYRPEGVIAGHDAIRSTMTPFFADTAHALRWLPTGATVAHSGDIGYTVGRWQIVPAGGGEPLSTGHYVTVWQRDTEGQWKVVADIGTTDAKTSS